MEELPWSAIGVLLAVALAHGGIVLLAMDERNRRKFPTRDEMTGLSERIERDLDGIGKKVDLNGMRIASVDGRVGELEDKTTLLEERQSQQWERIGEQMANTATTLRDVMKEVKIVAATTHELAIRMERVTRKGD